MKDSKTLAGLATVFRMMQVGAMNASEADRLARARADGKHCLVGEMIVWMGDESAPPANSKELHSLIAGGGARSAGKALHLIEADDDRAKVEAKLLEVEKDSAEMGDQTSRFYVLSPS